MALVGDFGSDAEILSSAGQYDHALTLRMVKIFLLAGGDGNENFRHPVRDHNIRIDKALRVNATKDKAAADARMIQEEVTYMDVCQIAEELYRAQDDTSDWPSSMNARDSKAPPSHHGAHLAETAPLTRRDVMALIQNGSTNGGNSKPGLCNNCKKPGHWRRECPELKKSARTSKLALESYYPS